MRMLATNSPSDESKIAISAAPRVGGLTKPSTEPTAPPRAGMPTSSSRAGGRRTKPD